MIAKKTIAYPSGVPNGAPLMRRFKPVPQILHKPAKIAKGLPRKPY